MLENDTYEMLESWYESIKGDKNLTLKETKELVSKCCELLDIRYLDDIIISRIGRDYYE